MGGALLLSNGGHGHGEELDKQGRGEREMTPERVESERLGMGSIWCGLASTLDEQGRMAVELCYGGGAQLAWRTRRHFVEHVACNEVAGVGGNFVPFSGRIGPWAKNEVCSTRPSLQL